MTWEDAGIYCDSLDFGGYSDWRLPTTNELLTIANKNTVNPSKFSQFSNMVSGFYWSSTTGAIESPIAFAWGVGFDNGSDGMTPAWAVGDGYGGMPPSIDSCYVRCVRVGQ